MPHAWFEPASRLFHLNLCLEVRHTMPVLLE